MPTIARILVADDDIAVVDAISHSLEQEHFHVEIARDGEDALEKARAAQFDVVILNVMMPRLFGTDVCRTLRSESDVPIILLSARDSELDRVLGLELGADDYVTKPFSMAELISRVRTMLRRRELDRMAAGGVRQVGDVRVDFARHQVTVERRDSSPDALGVPAADAPLRGAGAGLQPREIMEHLWQSPYVGDERAADIHISNLRRKIENDPRSPERLLTVRGAGYTLVRFVRVATQ